MHNTGQVIDGISGVNNIDCNALEAWNVTKGDNITIAVIDEGLEAHEDFGNRLIGGYTPATNGNGTPAVNSATHGMNSAGVAAASDNNLGIRGVASNANLLGVNIFVGATIGEAVDGIIWAVDNGADVLSNSWGFAEAPCNYTNVDIDNAIQYAVGSNGRNGKGCVVVFAAGNQGGCVEYPATNPNVIAVGAIDNQGNQYGYSARGPELDLVAPSGYRFGGIGVRTLDRMGASGNTPGNYRDDFDGTSAACPVVSGAAALVLSVNPNLTQQQVRNILLNTATDMGATGFDNNFGKGRVNALAAVEEALFGDVELTGDYLVCNSNEFFTLSQLPSGYNASWSVSANLQIVNSSNNGATVKAINSSAYGNGFIKATIGTKVIQKDVWVGRFNYGVTISGQTALCSGEDYAYYCIVPGGHKPGYTYTWTMPNSSWQVLIQNDNYLLAVPYGSNFAGQMLVEVNNGCGDAIGGLIAYPYCPGGSYYYSVSQNPNGTGYLSIDMTEKESDDDLAEVSNKVEIDNLKNEEKMSIEIYDFTGNIIIPKKVLDNPSRVDVTNLNKGIYLLYIYHNQEVVKKKIIIE